ncbi:MAG TPA: 23S rRNA (adenine(2503)-C(2))-methyltransferase RlmN, partial [Clostridia bacterium]|nr:23S rRNA (adenine(2503)-C(2))-methyltransferase RlmN [Clostridia bacterium]
MNLLDCKSMSLEELREQLIQRKIPAFRAVQIKTWLDNGTADFDKMLNLPLTLRQNLKNIFTIPTVNIEKKLVSSRDNTVKYLYRLNDGENVESVLMEYQHGWSQCLSTQVGCQMGCSFCATGMGGFVRNLQPSEMVAQIEKAQQDHNIRVSSVVLMGMGEPLNNFDNVLRFLNMLAEPGGVHIGMRHISLSTCGLVDKIYKLMEYKLQITLSISLHAPNNQIRSRLMPVNRKWPIEELLEACRKY